ncbi:MAG: hypothetical protein R3F17_17315 [Planctomycetota bacterium]
MKPLPFLLHSRACALALSPLASAQDGTRALLIVDPENPESMYVAHHYLRPCTTSRKAT